MPEEFKPLGEDVSDHTMGYWQYHADRRLCAWHHRLGKWATQDSNSKFTLECPREHK